MGIEIVAITAGEAEQPDTSIPRAMRTMVLRLIVFYLLAIGAMLMITPWNRLAEGGGDITGSPFVRAFAAVGIPYAASVMNLVVISAAFSSANTNLYTTSRMLFSLARSGFAPAQLARIGPSGVPRLAVTTASAGMVTAILLAIYSPGRAFLALYGIAVAGMLFVWTVILFTYLAFRQSLSPAQVEALPIRLPAHRFAAWCGIMSLTGIMITTLFVDGLRYTVPSFLPFLAIMSLVYIRTRPRATIV
jgi:amino acid transporter, AAT family